MLGFKPFRLGGRRRQPGSWSVVTTLRGTPQVVAPFVSHHLDMGAQSLFIYLDGPDPALQRLLDPLPQVQLTVCDEAHWQSMNKPLSTTGLVQRQLANARHAQQRAQSDWLLHIDSDEFLHPQQSAGASLAQELAELPRDMLWARIPNLERVVARETRQQGLFDGMFRDQVTDPDLEQRIYGEDHVFLRNGFSGYIRGKTAIRVSADLSWRLHLAQGPSGPAPHATLQNTRILHFDGWTPRHWITKIMRRVTDTSGAHSGRRAQITRMRDMVENPTGQLALFDRVQTLSPETEARLRAEGLLHDIGFDPRPSLARYFPGFSSDLTAASFDRPLEQDRPS